MISVSRNAGSFRDPAGYIFEADNRIFRTVSNYAEQEYNQLRDNGFYDKLFETGYSVSANEVNISDFSNLPANTALILEHPKIPFISYPYEWGFLQLKSAALLHLDLQIFALNHNVILKDSSAYNVQFIGSKPVFIDFLSFRQYQEGEYWEGHMQFCEQFLNPLLLRSIFGVPHNAWYRGNMEGIPTGSIVKLLSLKHKFSLNVLLHLVLPDYLQNRSQKINISSLIKKKNQHFPKKRYLNLLLQLKEWVTTLSPNDKHATTWSKYTEDNIYEVVDIEKKCDFIANFVREIKPKTVWDIGCNTGQYSELALRAGAKMVLGFDYDQQALDKAFNLASTKKLAFTPLFLDASNPTPKQGWNNSERKSLVERAEPDAVFSLAFIHHLTIAKNIPLEWVIDWIVKKAPSGIIEFVQKNDPTIQKMLSLRKDIHTEYCENVFCKILEKKAKIIQSAVISDKGRTLYWYQRSN